MKQKIWNGLCNSGASVASLLKVALQSRRASKLTPPDNPEKPLIIMGNGPSLRDVIDNCRSILEATTLMAVNFAANTSEFSSLRPAYYVLADGHFFNGIETDGNVAKLWENLKKTDWDMTLFVPANMKKKLPGLPGNVRIAYFNLTPAEGFDSLCHFLFRHSLAMPRPRNVLIASIMLALNVGFRNIVIVGADHSWSKTLWVDDKNRVISVQPHFYKDNEKEFERVANDYAGYHIHDIYRSLAIAFESYHHIARYAGKIGATIINATPGSFIDAFPRKTLDKIAKVLKID